MYNLGSAPMGDGGEEGGIAVGEVGFLARWCPIFVYFCALVSFGFWWGGSGALVRSKILMKVSPFLYYFHSYSPTSPLFFWLLTRLGKVYLKRGIIVRF